MIRTTSIGLLLVLLVLAGRDEAAERRANSKSPQRPQKTLGSPNRTHFDINRLQTSFWDDGLSDFNYGRVGEAGLTYPKGSGRSVIYVAGLWWNGQYGIGGDLRTGGVSYWSGLRCGKILPGMVAQSESLSNCRVYRVRPDIAPGIRTADVTSEQQDGEGSVDEIYNQYHKDWMEWPWQDGAPYDDVNGNGSYESDIDIPGVVGADQTIWFVANDLDAGNVTKIWGCNSMGIEMQVTVWGYNREGVLGNVLFRKYLLINKSSTIFDSMYVAMWVDPDLGSSSDDLVGCDTVRSIGFVYNGYETDIAYAPLPPPSAGFDFFQGPVVPADPTDSAIFLGKRVYGKKNLPMTAFFAFGASSDESYWDPNWYDVSSALPAQINNLVKGFSKDHKPWITPAGIETKFPFSGDPATNTGWLDGQLFAPGDRRFGLASGPFRMMPGDTQEVVVAEIAAGATQGTDRLTAVSLLKFYDDQAQMAYDNFFELPTAPQAPKVAVSALDKEVVLSWGDDLEAVNSTENVSIKGYAFQGYNVYQLPTASAAVSEGKRLATFDIIDGIQKIKDRAFDPAQGEVVTVVKQFGTDSGIRRFISLKTDPFTNGNPLVNGTAYYYAVTAYSFNPDPLAVPTTLENPLKIYTVYPHTPDPGTRYGGESGDTIAPVLHTTVPGIFPSDGTVWPLIVDPTKLTGHQYAVTFDSVSGIVSWRLTDMTSGVVKFSNQQNQSGDQQYNAVDGIQTVVSGPMNYGWRNWTIPIGGQHWTWEDATSYNLEGFNGAMGQGLDQWFSSSTVLMNKLRNVRIKFAGADGTWDPKQPQADPNFSRGYRYVRSASAPPAQPEFGPWIVNPDAGYAYQDYIYGVPFSAWNDQTTPPTRLMVGHLENNKKGGKVDGRYWPAVNGSADNYDGNGPREWFFIFDVPYSETPDPMLQVDILNNTLPIMWFGLPNRRAGVDSNFASADEFLILTNHPNVPGNTFTFTAPTNVIGDPALAKNDVSAINVFPNPYYGVNPQEIDKYQRFVTFSHLPSRATIRIFNLAGVMVRRIDRYSSSQFERWDLKNENGLPVGSGMYIAHIEMPDLGATKILKIAVVQEQQILDRY